MRSLLALYLVASLGLSACGDASPRLLHDDTIPDDLRELADTTWADFLAVVPERQSCVAPVTLHAAWELESRGEYQPDTATIVVRVPGTPATLRSELIHEFAHHIEFTCREHEEMRAAFLSAQGFPEEADWFSGDAWAVTPSEQYAEAMVELVDGTRTHNGGILLSIDAIAVVRQWGDSEL